MQLRSFADVDIVRADVELTCSAAVVGSCRNAPSGPGPGLLRSPRPLPPSRGESYVSALLAVTLLFRISVLSFEGAVFRNPSRGVRSGAGS